MATEITSGMGFAPLDSFGGGGGGDGGDGGDDEALVLEWGRRVRRGVGRGEKREEGMGDDRRVRMEWEVGNGGMDGWDLGMRRGRWWRKEARVEEREERRAELSIFGRERKKRGERKGREIRERKRERESERLRE